MQIKRMLLDKDKNIFFYINKRIKCNILDKIMPKITHIGGPFLQYFLAYL
ncbi:undecaprenyl-diphosphatase [Thermoanaerobacter thermohydrosulfuricus]|nr:undecaprenyl-diphosphatase [Thermoanaerobacter thermohydrosulfuricus]